MQSLCKTYTRFVLTIFFFSFFTLTINAQNSIKGKVTDNHTGEPLVGATVRLDNTKFITFVKLDGSYAFIKIPDGTYTIVITYQGYKATTNNSTISVAKDETKKMNFTLEPIAAELASVTITASANGSKEGNSRILEKVADPLLNVLSSKTIQLLPDITVANALQRVSGVTIEKSSNGQGRFPIIRGMEKRYINTLVNGIKIPSPDNKSRFIPLDLFPSELLERLEVSKTLTPSMEGDAVGGTINLVMKDAPVNQILQANFALGYNNIFDQQTFQRFDNGSINEKSPSEIKGNTYAALPSDFSVAHLNYTNQANPVNATFGLTYGNRFGKDKKLGLLISGSYQNLYSGTSSTIFITNGQPNLNNIPQFTNLQYREYSTQNQRLGLNAKLDYKFNGRNKISFFTTYVKLSDFQMRQISDTVALNSLVTESFRSTWQYQSIYNSTLQGNHKLGEHVFFDWSIAYSIANNNTPDQSSFSHQYSVLLNTVTGEVRKGTPDIVSGMSRTWIRNSDQDVSMYLNFTHQTKLFSKAFELKMGGLIRDKNRDNFYNSYSLNPQIPATGGNQDYTNINSAVFTFKGTNALASLNGNNYNFKERVIAAYLQGKWSLTDQLEWMGGVRYERTNQEYATELGLDVNEKSGRISYTDILPSTQFKYQITSTQALRLSYYKALTRPQFAELVPFGADNFELFKELGNPTKLEHTTADNYDLRYEFFPGNADQILLGAFYKRIKDPIEITVVKVGQTTEQNLKPINIGVATNYGFEAVFTKYFGSFGISANYTYTQSSVTNDSMLFYYRSSTGSQTTKYVSETRPLQGQSNHIGNLSLIYKNPKNGFDAQVAFVYTGERISLLSPFTGLHYWQKPTLQLDISFEKRIVPKFSLYGKITNITNTPSEVIIKQSYNDYSLSPGARALSLQTDATNVIAVQKDFFKTAFLFGCRYKL